MLSTNTSTATNTQTAATPVITMSSRVMPGPPFAAAIADASLRPIAAWFSAATMVAAFPGLVR